MPRNGDGSSDNVIPKEDQQNIIHGAGNDENAPLNRVEKVADLPEPEAGEAIKDMDASAGDSKGKDQGGRSSTN